MQNTIAVIFDFDDTLTPDSTSSFLDSVGVDVHDFWHNRANPLIQNGWDPIPAYLYLLLEESKIRKEKKLTPFTCDLFLEFGSQLKFYNGVTRVFTNLKQLLEKNYPEVRLEFYLVSSGIGDIIRSSSIAKYFKAIWTSDFHYQENEEISFPKRVLSFTDKTRYLFQISKGVIGERSHNKPFDVNKKISDSQLRVPFNQMIFVGDGMTDVPCFSLIRKEDGVAFGVYDPNNQDKWGRAWGFIEDGRVSNLLPTDYGQKSALYHSLSMAVESIAAKIMVREKSYQG